MVNVRLLRAELERRIEGEVRFDRIGRALYSTDASVYQMVPLAVVLPRCEQDVAVTLSSCAALGVPITARGGGTSQAGQAIGPGVVLDFSKYLGSILEINGAERWARVQPGCVLDDLNLAVRSSGLQFAPDISTSNRATIGGMIANNSSGTHSLIHGKTVDHVVGLRVLLADGQVIEAGDLNAEQLQAKCRQQDREGACYRAVLRLGKEHAEEIDRRFPRLLRRVGGYNLDHFLPSRIETGRFNLAPIFVGSEGTLGLTLEARVRLIGLPRTRGLLVVQFAELLEALEATPAILVHEPAAVEVLDRYILDSTRLNPEASRLRGFLAGEPGAVLLIEFYGDDGDELASRIEALRAEMAARGWGYHFTATVDPGEQTKFWKLRKMALGLSMAQKGDAKAISFVEDTAVAVEHLRAYIAEFLAVVARHGTTAGVYAHASVGCLHVRPVINLKTEAGIRQFEGIADEVADLVLKYGGSLSGEHGDGMVRSPFQERMFGPEIYQAFRELKRTFDPLGLLNPGKIVDALPLTANLRSGPVYVTPAIVTTFDFSQDGGMLPAAELCAGVGECRKTREGTMCPSYQATREEEHSTRGRANALRLALTGQMELGGLTDPSLRPVFDLCLECKACKSECPTNVDMARLKAEFLHQFYQKHGLPLRNRIFGHVAALSGRAASIPRLANFILRAGPMRWLNEFLFGIDRRRMPPALNHRTLTRRILTEGLLADRPGNANVMLFPDTFTEFYEPEQGLALGRLLRRMGIEMTMAKGARCCGRPFISNGMLDQAVAHARHNVERLFSWAAAGKPIVACEPSCILTIKDDYPALLAGTWRTKADAVAGACLTCEEYLDAKLACSGSLPFRAGPKKVLVQGHCHQRSLTGMRSTIDLLGRIPAVKVVDLDAGCCGMAGSFGYEREHFELSRQVGERLLFPAVRAAEQNTVVVAAGFSCRLQIRHFTGREAMHPVVLLDKL